MAGLECCCVSVAAAPLGDGNPTMGDVTAACVAEIKTDGVFVAERGSGLPANLSPNTTCRGCSGPSASAAARRSR